MEEAYKLERESEETLLQAIQLCSLYHLQDTLNAVEEGNDENRLLPAMNKIWPFLVVCVQHKNQVVRVFVVTYLYQHTKTFSNDRKFLINHLFFVFFNYNFYIWTGCEEMFRRGKQRSPNMWRRFLLSPFL